MLCKCREIFQLFFHSLPASVKSKRIQINRCHIFVLFTLRFFSLTQMFIQTTNEKLFFSYSEVETFIDRVLRSVELERGKEGR
jgi:hypothetical protein